MFRQINRENGVVSERVSGDHILYFLSLIIAGKYRKGSGLLSSHTGFHFLKNGELKRGIP